MNKKIIHFLKLIRYQNLILIVVAQFFIQHYIIEDFHFNFKQDKTFYLLIISTALIASSGYIINDVLDQKTDTINKKQRIIIGKYISSRNAIFWYYTLNFIGIISSIMICINIQKLYLIFIFMICIYLLWTYSKKYKYSIYGNLIVSLLISLSMINVLLFHQDLSFTIRELIMVLFYAFFSFLINITREIIKDIEDLRGDAVNNTQNLVMTFGTKKSKKICITLLILLILIICYAQYITHISRWLKIEYLYSKIYSIIILLCIFYSMILIWKSSNKKDFNYISKVLKIIMILGVISIPIITKS